MCNLCAVTNVKTNYFLDDNIAFLFLFKTTGFKGGSQTTHAISLNIPHAPACCFYLCACVRVRACVFAHEPETTTAYV